MPKQLTPGIYAPTQVFYIGDTEELDTKTIAKHAARLAKAGVAGIVANGSNGEAVYLALEERTLVSSTTRRALDSAGFAHLLVIVGATE
jgi:dihydrodipicolinate synthase/N-acetylneuraminate lyase